MRSVVFVCALLVSSVAFGATYVVPPDAELIRAADAIAVVRVQSSHSYRTADGRIATDYVVVVERSLKGADSTMVLTQKGGVVGDWGMGVSGEPHFANGERVLLMMQRLQPGKYTTLSGELGKFNFLSDRLVMRGAAEGEIFGWNRAGERHVERVRDAAAFLRYIESVVAGGNPTPGYVSAQSVSAPIQPHVAATDYTELNGSNGIRINGGAMTFQSTNLQSGIPDLTGAIGSALDAWNSVSDSDIDLTYSGGGGSGVYEELTGPDFQNLLFFDQPDSGPLGGNVVGQANYFYSLSTHPHGGSTFHPLVDCDVSMQAGLTGALFQAVFVHEVGHCLGFRHSNQPAAGQTTNTTDAVMNSQSNGNPALRQWDRDAATHVYGSAAGTCEPPSITFEPTGMTLTQGQAAHLTVTASGTAPLSYQWYIGNTHDTSQPTGENSSALHVTPSITTTYWVRVTGPCGPPANSAAATVTVNPAGCTAPSIVTNPESVAITDGQVTTLTVVATGTGPLSYQWYQGNAPSTANPVGSNNPALSVQPSTTTTYWVRVSGQCPPDADSLSATVTVTACPQVTDLTTGVAQQANGSYLLFADANGNGESLVFQWFRGNTPGVGGTFLGNGQDIIVPAPTAPTSYWVRAVNSCSNSIVSDLIPIDPCGLPAITTQPADQTIAAGASTSLTVAFTSASTTTVRWYRGAAGDKSVQVGTGATLNTGALNATTQFWASLTNSCPGETQTRTVTVTVSNCTKPAIASVSPDTFVPRNATATLGVQATGTATLNYQWYEGASGDTSKPVGTNSSTFITPPITGPKEYWVKVTNACGDVSSRAIRVDVGTRKRHAVRH